MVPGFSLDTGDQPVDMRSMPPAVAEVYVMVLLNAARSLISGPMGRRYIQGVVLLVPPFNPRAVLVPSSAKKEDMPPEERGSATSLGVCAMLRRLRLRHTTLPEDGQVIISGEDVTAWVRSTARRASAAVAQEMREQGWSAGVRMGQGIQGQARSIRTMF